MPPPNRPTDSVSLYKQQVHSQVVALQLIQDGMHKDIARLQQPKTLEKSNLDLVKQLAVKTAQCDELRKGNVDLKNDKENNFSHPITPPHQQHREPMRCEPTKDTLGERIDAFNAGLAVVSAEKKCSFVDNDNYFKM